MTLKQFEQIVAEALDTLPAEFAGKLDNVEIIIEDWPTNDVLRASNIHDGHLLLGLYQGIPKTKRNNYSFVLPDKISIFKGPILRVSGIDPDKIKYQIKKTLLHEIGHHFGMTEQEIRNAQF